MPLPGRCGEFPEEKGKGEGAQQETRSSESKPWVSPGDPEREPQEEVMTKDKASQASQEEVDPRDTHQGQRRAMQKERQQTELQPAPSWAQETGQSLRTQSGPTKQLEERCWSHQRCTDNCSWGSSLTGPGAQGLSPDQAKPAIKDSVSY